MTTGFRRELGVFDATMLVAGAIIGVGIFVNPGNVARLLPQSGWMLTAWIAGGAVAMAGGFVFAELGSRLPKVGGQYVYLERSWGRYVGFLYGFALLFVINSGGVAAVASAMAGYVDRTFVPLGTAGRLALAAAVIVGLAEINVRGVVPGKRVTNALMAAKLAGIAALGVLVVFRNAAPATDFELPTLELQLLASGVTPSLFLAALVPVLFAYGGWQNCGSVAAEIRDPGRTLARANVLGVALVVLVYVGLNVLYLWVLPPAEVASSTALAADVARQVAGDAGAKFVAGLIVVSCLGFIAVITLTGPRLYFAMAEDGLFLERARRLHPTHGTPSFTIRLQSAVALLLLLTQSYDQLLSYVVFCDFLFFALAAAGLFLLRRRDPKTGPPAGVFKTPGHPFTTAAFALVGLGVVLNCFATAPRQALAGCAVLAIGTALYLALRHRAAGATRSE